MKNKLIILLSFVVHSFCLFGQWTTIKTFNNPYLNAIHFSNDSTGYLAGGTGTGISLIFKTINSGQDWDTTSSNGTQVWFCIYFNDENIGNVGGYGGTLMHTIDAGNIWDVKNNSGGYIYSMSFPNNGNVGYATMAIPWSNGLLLKTLDKGESWQQHGSIQFPYGFGYLGNGIVKSLYFIDTTVGYAVADGDIICRTTDGGINWNFISIGFSQYDYNSVFFVNKDTGYVVGRAIIPEPCNCGIILKTTDGGLTWSNQFFSYGLNAVYFQDSKVGYATGNSGTILKTTDGGQTWNSEVSTSLDDLVGISFPSRTL